MTALAKLSGTLQAAVSCDMVGLLLDFAGETLVDELEVAPFVLLRQGAHSNPIVVVALPELQVVLSADTGRHAALLLSGMNRNGMAMALLEACDLAEASAHRIDRRAH